MARLGEHRDVGPRAEDAVVQRADEDGPYLRMLEAEPLDGVVELDVHSKVVGVHLELVVPEPCIFVHVQVESRHLPVYR